MEDLIIVVEALLGPLAQEDLQLPKLPFLRSVYSAVTPITVGVYASDGFFDPAPAVARAVREAEALLRSNPLVTNAWGAPVVFPRHITVLLMHLAVVD